MKKTLLFIGSSIICLQAWVQNEPAKQTSNTYGNAYTKGNWRMPLMQNFRLSHSNLKYGSTDYSSQNRLGVNIETDYFFMNNWAIGIDLSTDYSKIKYEVGDNSNKDFEWSTGLSVLYGMPISSNKIFWNVRLGVGIGGDKETDKTASNTTTDKIKIWDYEGITGLDIRNSNSNVFINPFVGYSHFKKDYGDENEDFGQVKFGVRLVSNMHCSDYMCDHKTGCSTSRNLYNQGRSFIGYTTKGMMSFGHYDVTNDNIPANNYEGNENQGHLRFDYNYFVIDHLAVGLRLNYQYAKDKEKDADYESSNHTFMAGPQITGFLPVDNCWRNLFGEVGASFGTERLKISSSGSTSKDKQSITNLWGGVGYNFVVSPNLAACPIIDYMHNKFEDKILPLQLMNKRQMALDYDLAFDIFSKATKKASGKKPFYSFS